MYPSKPTFHTLPPPLSPFISFNFIYIQLTTTLPPPLLTCTRVPPSTASLSCYSQPCGKDKSFPSHLLAVTHRKPHPTRRTQHSPIPPIPPIPLIPFSPHCNFPPNTLIRKRFENKNDSNACTSKIFKHFHLLTPLQRIPVQKKKLLSPCHIFFSGINKTNHQLPSHLMHA